MADSQQPKFVTTADGRRITYARWKYEQSRQQEAILRQVNDLITAEATNAVAAGAGLGQQEYGAFLRDLVVPNLLDKYGKINATAAIQFYDQSRTQWEELYSSASTGGRDARRSASSRFARARTQGAINAAQGYAAQFADTYDLVGKTDTVVNFAMKVRAKSGQAPSVSAMNNALTREVAAYHRDTILFNSALDPYVQRVQRVAQASACEFCRLMALGSTNGKVRTSTYAVKFHSHCHCTIQPLFDGEQPVRPDYYDKFEKEYAAASKNGGSAKSILADWRIQTKSENETSLSLKSLFDLSREDAKQTLKNVFENKTFGEYKIRYDSILANRNSVKTFADIVDNDLNIVGKVVREFKPTENGISVYHDILQLNRSARGKGFGTAFSEYSETIYRNSGVDSIRLFAGLENGAYTWAKAGYSWFEKPNSVINRLVVKADGIQDQYPETAERIRKLVTRLKTGKVDSPEYPTPFEIANMKATEPGFEDVQTLGKYLLSDTGWEGIKKL